MRVFLIERNFRDFWLSDKSQRNVIDFVAYSAHFQIRVFYKLGRV